MYNREPITSQRYIIRHYAPWGVCGALGVQRVCSGFGRRAKLHLSGVRGVLMSVRGAMRRILPLPATPCPLRDHGEPKRHVVALISANLLAYGLMIGAGMVSASAFVGMSLLRLVPSIRSLCRALWPWQLSGASLLAGGSVTQALPKGSRFRALSPCHSLAHARLGLSWHAPRCGHSRPRLSSLRWLARPQLPYVARSSVH